MKVIVYTSTYCGFCNAAKSLLQSKGLDFEEIDLTSDHELRLQVSEKAGGYRMVPMIFIDDQFIGGFQELQALDQQGKLV